jgi:hypothetical protein
MKTDCVYFDECRKPVQACTNKCPDYKKSEEMKEIARKRKLFRQMAECI